MGLGERIGASWEILKACFKVLNEERMLVLYPLISMLATGIIFVVFFGFYAIISIGTSAVPEWSSGMLVVSIIGIYLLYVCLYFVAIFSNVAIVGCAKMRLDGEDPKFSDGFKIAFSRLPAIFGWALVAATVGLILSLLRGGKYTKWIARLLNFAWNVITYFVVPVIVVENLGPIAAIKRSLQILKKTWGEALILNFGLGMIFGIFVLIYVIIIVLILVVASAFIPVFLAVLAIGFLGLLVLGAIYTTLKGILQAALYKYATTGVAGYGFTNYQLDNMFSPRGSSGRGLMGGGGMFGGAMGGGRSGF